jgi:hypothetical protein
MKWLEIDFNTEEGLFFFFFFLLHRGDSLTPQFRNVVFQE